MIELLYPMQIARVLRDAEGTRAEEMLPVLDENGQVVAQMSRSYAHGGSKRIHPVVHLHLVDRMGRVCLQKRSMSKKLLPGRWDTAVGGHVSYGETIDETLYREASEELGLTDFNPVLLDTYIYESDIEREMIFVFAAVGNHQLPYANDEVDELKYWTEEEISAARGRSILTPNFESEYDRIHDALFALL